MGFDFIGGMAAAGLGFYKGMDDAAARKDLAAERENKQVEREYLKTQREFQAGQQKRKLAEQGRQDRLDEELRGVQPTYEASTPAAPERAGLTDDDGAPSAAALPVTTTKQRTTDEMARARAAAYDRAGQFKEAREYEAFADKVGWERSARGFDALYASAPGKTTQQIVEEAASIFNNDPFAGSVENIKYGPNGSVTYDAVNKTSGARLSRSFANSQQLLEGLRSFYSPETFKALQSSRLKLAEEVAKENAKPRVLGAGGALVSADGGKLVENNNGYVQVGTDEDGNPINVKAGTGGGGRGAGSGKKSEDPVTEVFERIAKESEVKFPTPEARQVAKVMADRISVNNGGKVPPELAALTAIKLQTNPALEVPAVNPDTGMIQMVVKDARNGDIVTRPDYADWSKVRDLKPEQLKELVSGMQKELPGAEFEALRDAAFDKSGKAARRYLEAERAKLMGQLREDPRYKSQPDAVLAKAVDKHLASFTEPALQRKASLLSMYATSLGSDGYNMLKFDDNGVRVKPNRTAPPGGLGLSPGQGYQNPAGDFVGGYAAP